jgi:hypothetical protein
MQMRKIFLVAVCVLFAGEAQANKYVWNANKGEMEFRKGTALAPQLEGAASRLKSSYCKDSQNCNVSMVVEKSQCNGKKMNMVVRVSAGPDRYVTDAAGKSQVVKGSQTVRYSANVGTKQKYRRASGLDCEQAMRQKVQAADSKI